VGAIKDSWDILVGKDRNVLDDVIKPLAKKIKQRTQAKNQAEKLQPDAKENEPSPPIPQNEGLDLIAVSKKPKPDPKPKKIAIIAAIIFLSVIVLAGSASLVVIHIKNRAWPAMGVPISTDPSVILKWFSGDDSSKNNVVIRSLGPELTTVTNGFNLKVKKTAFDGLPADYKDCFYDIYIAPGDARPTENGGKDSPFYFYGANFCEVLGVDPYVTIRPSAAEDGSRQWNTLYPSNRRSLNPYVMGNKLGYDKPGYAIDIDINLEQTGVYSANQRFYTLAIVVWDANSGTTATQLGYSDLYTIELEQEGISNPTPLTGEISVVTLTGKDVPTTFIIIAIITGASILALLALVGAHCVLKRKKTI